MKKFIIASWAFFCFALVSGNSQGEEENDHSHHHDGGSTDHMGHMEEVREWLKKELGDQYDKPIPSPTAAQLEKGKEIFQTRCVLCHGEKGKGDGPAAAALSSRPADFTDPMHSAFYSDRGRIHIIKKGVPNTPMVGWESTLSPEEIQAVYYYIRSLRAGEEKPATHEHHGNHDMQMHDHGSH